MTAAPDDDQPGQPAQPPAGGSEPPGTGPASAGRAQAAAGSLAGDDGLGGCLTGAEIAELSRQDWDPADADFWCEDPESGAPELPAAEWARLQAEDDQRAEAVPEAFDAGFSRHCGGTPGTGFAAGGPLDVMLPGSDLAWHVGQARRDLTGLDDDQLTGVMIGGQKLEAWASEVKLAAVSELDRRRTDRDGEEGQKVAEEISAALTLTPRAADLLAGLAGELGRLPQIRALLANGIIDLPRVRVITRFTGVLPDEDVAAVEDVIARRAGDLSTGRLTACCDMAVKAVDPAAAQRRKDKALRSARVEAWAEPDGTAALAGRDLPPAQVITADKMLDADARWLHGHGAGGSHDELRALAYMCRLNHQPLDTLLPPAATTGSAGPAAAGTHDAPADTRGNGTSDPAGPATAPGAAAGHPARAADAAAGNPAQAPGTPAGPALGGTVNLTMPLLTWQGQSASPGEVSGFGAADASTCRDLATRMTAAGPATKWCITITDPDGRATGHGCARAGPGPPGGHLGAWLTSIKLHKIQTSDCSHEHQSAGYQPSPTLRNLIKTRSRRCGYPGCGRPAISCDDDHTLAYHLGGRTCECNLHPLCRRHHRAKQAPGWHLEQPRPGVLIWTLPSGRRYTSTSDPYPI